MIDPPWPPAFSQRLQIMQFIVIALAMGLIAFLGSIGFALAQPLPLQALRAGTPIVTYVGCGMAAYVVLARGILLRFLTTKTRRAIVRGTFDDGLQQASQRAFFAEHGDAARLLSFFQTRMIVGAALLEGAGFFLLIAYLIEHSPWSLAGAVVMIVGIVLHFPTRGRVESWLEQQLRLLEEERQLEGTNSR